MRLLHRLIHLYYGIPPDFVLNESPAAPAGPTWAEDLSRWARELSAAALLDDGGVDYRTLRSHAAHRQLCQRSAGLAAFDPGTLVSHAERLAFWINVYNALIVDAVVQLGVRRSVREVPGFLWRAAYRIGGRRLSAHDIEHGILRANRPHPGLPGRHFAPSDPRLDWAAQRLDARIHFALVCGARSCPPIQAYEAQRLEAQLDTATRAFVNGGGAQLDEDGRTLRLSPIFRWYAADFGAGPLALYRLQPLLSFLARHAQGQLREVLQRGAPRVRFLAYDWSLNASGLDGGLAPAPKP